MKNRRIILFTLAAISVMSASAQLLPYQNASLTADERADDLLGRLTLEEKVKLTKSFLGDQPIKFIDLTTSAPFIPAVDEK